MLKMLKRGIFLDRDGVINVDRDYVFRIEDFTLIDGVLEACQELKRRGFSLIVITNQSGIARGFYTETDLAKLNAHIFKIFEQAQAPLSGIYYCPHLPNAPIEAYRSICRCRKPAPGLFLQAAEEHAIDLSRSFAFGDKDRDLEAAERAGIPARILLGKNGLSVPEKTGSATGTARSLLDSIKLGLVS